MANNNRQDGPDWGGMSHFAGTMQRMGTPFETQMVKDAAQGYGGMMQGAMAGLGAGLQANANRVAQNRDTMMNAAMRANPVPYGMDGKGFNDWMDQNAAYRRRMMGLEREQMLSGMQNQSLVSDLHRAQQNQGWIDRMQYELPYKQQLLSQVLNGMGGGVNTGYTMGTGGGAGGGYNTNFGASGWF